MLKVVGPLLVMVACKHTAVEPAAHEPALDVMGFEPPFEEVPVAQAFVVKYHVKSVAVDEVDAAMTVRTSVVTRYDDKGAPISVFERAPGHGFELDLILSTMYVPGAPSAPVAPNRKLVSQDANGRTVMVHTAGAVETWIYDAGGQLVRIAREADGKHFEELRTYDGGHLVKRTRGEVGAPPFETLVFTYDHGRVSEWRGSKPGYTDDRYTFRYDASGQLAEMRFVESGKDIYQRTYAYDADGFVTRVDQHASVPAMGSAVYIYEYELPEGHRAPIPVVFPKGPARKTDADVLAEIGTVFHLIAGTGVVVRDRGDQHLVTVTFDVAATDAAALTTVELAAKACSLRQALGLQCDCEALDRGAEHGGAVTLTLHVNLGC